MRVLPSKEEVRRRTIPVCIMVISMSYLWFYRECCHIWKHKHDEFMETARFNDLDGDGISNVIVYYKNK